MVIEANEAPTGPLVPAATGPATLPGGEQRGPSLNVAPIPRPVTVRPAGGARTGPGDGAVP
jgi:hypothetical protein